MQQYFPFIDKVIYEGAQTENQFAYRYYNPQKKILGKTMVEHLRIAVCYWHTFHGVGSDQFGAATRSYPWDQADTAVKIAEQRLTAAFEFFTKLNVPYFTFHDIDLAPAGKNLAESIKNLQHMVELTQEQINATGVKLLWGTANLFSHPRYMAGAATSPDPEVFAYAATQIKYALEATHKLGGCGYVLWGGREGYDSLLNTDVKRELEQFGKFLSLVVEHKHKIGFTGDILIEPKPCEPTKHQYDFDCAAVYACLQKFGLEAEVKVNIEANHATLACHSFEDEIAYAIANNIFGSIDINRGNPENGWDTDQFPNSVEETSLILYRILSNSGFKNGGFNFDAKLRRQSTNLEDLFYAHIGGIDVLAKSLLIAAKMLAKDKLKVMLDERYRKWNDQLGQAILNNQYSLDSLAKYAVEHDLDPLVESGRQELLENLVNQAIE